MTGSNHVEQSKCSTAGMVTFSLGLISGTFSALFCKMAYDTSATGLDGKQKLFAKPMMMLLLMFTAMAPAIVFWLIQQAMRKPHEREVSFLPRILALNNFENHLSHSLLL
jgi:hypothetical protein